MYFAAKLNPVLGLHVCGIELEQKRGFDLGQLLEHWKLGEQVTLVSIRRKRSRLGALAHHQGAPGVD
jgi:hypothetical protein